MFPFGGKADGLHERFVVYNPGDDQAEVEVAVDPRRPGPNGEVDPFAVTVNPRSWAVVDLDEEDRIPTKVDHAAVVTSRNGVPVVAERLLFSTEPLETVDVAISPGSPLLSDRWIFAAGGTVPGRHRRVDRGRQPRQLAGRGAARRRSWTARSGRIGPGGHLHPAAPGSTARSG